MMYSAPEEPYSFKFKIATICYALFCHPDSPAVPGGRQAKEGSKSTFFTKKTPEQNPGVTIFLSQSALSK